VLSYVAVGDADVTEPTFSTGAGGTYGPSTSTATRLRWAAGPTAARDAASPLLIP
jgi:hypothetical protein